MLSLGTLRAERGRSVRVWRSRLGVREPPCAAAGEGLEAGRGSRLLR